MTHFLEGSTDISGDIGTVEVGVDAAITNEENVALQARARQAYLLLNSVKELYG